MDIFSETIIHYYQVVNKFGLLEQHFPNKLKEITKLFGGIYKHLSEIKFS
jgi:hypothetical protein